MSQAKRIVEKHPHQDIQCKDCKFFHMLDESGQRNICIAVPPVAVITGHKPHPLDPRGQMAELQPIYPMIPPNFQACGLFEERDFEIKKPEPKPQAKKSSIIIPASVESNQSN